MPKTNYHNKDAKNFYASNLQEAVQIVEDGERILNELASEGYKIPQSYRKVISDVRKMKSEADSNQRKGISADTLNNVRFLFRKDTLARRVKADKSNQSIVDKIYNWFDTNNAKAEESLRKSTDKHLSQIEKQIARNVIENTREKIKEEKLEMKLELKSAAVAQRLADKKYRESLTSEAARLRQLGRDMKELERSYDDLRTKKFGPNAGPDNSITGVNIETYNNVIANNPDLDLTTITQKKLREIYEDPDKTNKLYRLTDYVKTAKEHLPLTAMKFRTKSMKEFKNQVLAKWGNMAHVKTLKGLGWNDNEISKLENFIDSSSLWQSIRSQGYESETEVNIQQSDGSIRNFIAHKGRHDIRDFLGDLRTVIQTGTDDDIENFIVNRLRN